MTTENPTSERGGARRAPFWIALALHILIGLARYAVAGLMVPGPGLLVLAVIWIGLLVVLMRWRPGNQWLLLLVPLAALVLWYVVVLTGEAVFGWTA